MRACDRPHWTALFLRPSLIPSAALATALLALAPADAAFAGGLGFHGFGGGGGRFGGPGPVGQPRTVMPQTAAPHIQGMRDVRSRPLANPVDRKLSKGGDVADRRASHATDR